MDSKYLDNEAALSGDDSGDEHSGDDTNDSMVCSDNEVEFESGVDDDEKVAQQQFLSNKEFKQHRKKLDARRKRHVVDAGQGQAEALGDALEADRAAKRSRASKKSAPISGGAAAQFDAGDAWEVPKARTGTRTGKTMPPQDFPPKPKNFGMPKQKEVRNYSWNLKLINPNLFLKFLQPFMDAVPELEFTIDSTPSFSGIRLLATNSEVNLAMKSQFECHILGGDVQPNVHGSTFSVITEQFIHTLQCALVSDTVMNITRYTSSESDLKNPDKITFEATSNENDIASLYACSILASSNIRVASTKFDAIRLELNYRATLKLKMLKDVCQNASKCGATFVSFSLSRCTSSINDNETIVHSCLTVGFVGTMTSGSHDFFQSSRARKNASGAVDWEQLPSLSSMERNLLPMEKCSSNAYDNQKLLVFLKHIDSEWVHVSICDSKEQRPLLLDVEIGGQKTKHTILIGPRNNSEE